MNAQSDSIPAVALPVNGVAPFRGRGVRLEKVGPNDSAAQRFSIVRRSDFAPSKIERDALLPAAPERQVLAAHLFRKLRGSVFVAHSVRNADLLYALSSRVRALYCALHGVPAANRVALAARSRLAVCNLAEFAQMAALVGIACPREEETASLEAVAFAVRTYLTRVPAGDLVVTLGSRGAIAGKSRGLAVAHVAMRFTLAQRESLAILQREPQRLRRIGARFFTALVVAYADAEDLFRAVREAMATVINTVVTGLRAGVPQAELRLFPH